MTIGSADLQNLRSLVADDPVRAVQALPGVAGADDFRSDFTIRASDFRHIGVTLDGVPSPLLVHTVRNLADTGSLAMINSDILESVSLLAGTYPQRHGNRTGAQVDFRTREGSRSRAQLRAAISAINASIVAEGPLGTNRRGSWLVSARKRYIDWLLREIDPDVTGTFRFIDAQAKAVYDIRPRHTLQVNIVAGRFHAERSAKARSG
jgi:TonB-dependent Receptor Plug Domain